MASNWQERLIGMIVDAAKKGGGVNPHLFSLSNGRGGYVDGRAVRLFLDKLAVAGTVVKEKGWYRAVE